MFVLPPPPPKYPTQAGYPTAVPGSTPSQMVETNNQLSHPSGPQYQFLVGEGLYVLKEDLHLATPPPHPSEAPVVNPNPLSTAPQPATSGTKVSLITLDIPNNSNSINASSGPSTVIYRTLSRKDSTIQQQQQQQQQPIASTAGSIREHPDESQSSTDVRESISDAGRLGTSSAGGGNAATASDVTVPLFASSNASSSAATPAFGESNSLLSSQRDSGSSKGKLRKPKNNMSKTNSSFISRVICHEALGKRLQERAKDGLLAFANVGRAFQWLDLSSAIKAEYLTKILLTRAHCLCHDVNKITKSQSHIDMVMGFSTGEIIWWEPISQRYTRLNKNGIINRTPVSEIKWIPGSENLFLAAHWDGSLVVYDKEKEDAAFVSEDDAVSGGRPSVETVRTSRVNYSKQMHVLKSVNSKNQKTNPVAVWKLSNHRINAFAFSPDCRHLAVVSEDGSLRVIDYLREELLHIFYSYYSGFTCVCWSPDGKYIVTGGQDDLLSIWCPSEASSPRPQRGLTSGSTANVSTSDVSPNGTNAAAAETDTLNGSSSAVPGGLVARCQGHHSWVTSVAFDPWRCDDKNYRFGSVGEDCRICLWDFSVGMLNRPRAASVRQRGASNSFAPESGAVTSNGGEGVQGSRVRSDSTMSSMSRPDTANASAPAGAGDDSKAKKREVLVHPVQSRAATAMLPPVLSKVIDDDPLSWIGFTPDAIMTSCKSGHIRTWSRPSELTPEVGGHTEA